MEEDISSNYICYPTAKELWDNITPMYLNLGNQSQIYELTIKLGEIRYGKIWTCSMIMSGKSTEDCNHNRKMVEDHRIYKFLVGLKIEFDEARGRIIGCQPLPAIGDVFAEVRREESR
ncbi:hypothetical protein ACSBR2_008352 [Camellia fascicularis]